MVLGLVLARITLFMTTRIGDVATMLVFRFGWTFGDWMLGERLHRSGIITMVVSAMAAAAIVAMILARIVRVTGYSAFIRWRARRRAS